MLINNPKLDYVSYFTQPSSMFHRQYVAVRRFIVDGLTADQVARETGFAKSTVYSLVRDFKASVDDGTEDPFFKENAKSGRPPADRGKEVEEQVISLRKKYYSVPDIQIAMDAFGEPLTVYAIERILDDAGFAKMPRRGKGFREAVKSIPLETEKAPIASRLVMEEDGYSEHFSSERAGLLLFIPIIIKYGIDKAILETRYPETGDIGRLSSILSFLALKLTDVKRYSADDIWCMDRGTGLFAGLTVLPKTAWFSSYSSRITRDMNVEFLRGMRSIWQSNGMLSDTVNLDFTAIPYWGDDEPLENNWSGKRNKALQSIQSVLAQDPDSGLLIYGDTTVRHDRQDDAILEFLDFYHSDRKLDKSLKYLIFDSKFTTYKNLSNLNQRGIKFITVRRRSKTLVARIDSIDDKEFKKVTVAKAEGTHRVVTCFEESGELRDYDGTVRQVYIRDNGRQKPAILITNDFDIPLVDLIYKYSHRWLIETDISEHIDFFHLNLNSSGIVVKVDFDLTITILAHNLYRLMCHEYSRYGFGHFEAQTMFDRLISGSGYIATKQDHVCVILKKKRNHTQMLEVMPQFSTLRVPWLNHATIEFKSSSTT